MVVVGLWLFLVLQLVGLQCAIVIFPDVTFLDISYLPNTIRKESDYRYTRLQPYIAKSDLRLNIPYISSSTVATLYQKTEHAFVKMNAVSFWQFLIF